MARFSQGLFYCFRVRPWHRSVPKSLRKQPKLYLWDWSIVADTGARNENLVASHLLKAVHWWTDIGLGSFGLYYLRDKAKREIDFLVTRNSPFSARRVAPDTRHGYIEGSPGKHKDTEEHNEKLPKRALVQYEKSI